jgi:hypothetical protein
LSINDGHGNNILANLGGNLFAFLTQQQWAMQQCDEQDTKQLQRVFKDSVNVDVVVSFRSEKKTNMISQSVDIRYLKFHNHHLGIRMF